VQTQDPELVRRLQQGDRAGLAGTPQGAMLDYVDKLTLRPGDMDAGDVEALRAAGFTDGDILDIANVAAYYAYVNRLAQGLGVELEAHRRR
jgi:uncharacterized peroxidase-related enzyme